MQLACAADAKTFPLLMFMGKFPSATQTTMQAD